MFLAITAYMPGSWGRDESEAVAIRNMRTNYRRDISRRKVEDFDIYKGGPSITCSEMGGVMYAKAEGEPKLIRRVRNGKDQPLPLDNILTEDEK